MNFPKIGQAAVFLLTAWIYVISGSASEAIFPRVWTTYRVQENFDADFQELKSHGIGAVHAHLRKEELPNLLSAARKHDMKLIISVKEVSECAYDIPPDKVERAVMIGGAYNGKAIDRYRFSFSPAQHEIIIENPVYDKENCYGELGRYFPGMRDPIRAEAIVKQRDFDGIPHLRIVPASTENIDETHWIMRFDLTGVEGDLDHVGLAVYWISEGTRKYWMFGDAASAFAKSTRNAVAEAVREEIETWKKANGGIFPKDDIIALRFGDECFHVSGHLNSADCSHPLWDYSSSAINAFKKKHPNLEYPRGKGWIDMFGREAYANWMHAFHRACADLVKEVKHTLSEEGLPDLPLFRNITRSNVFSYTNDHDGTGLELLVNELDIVHLDPYPVNAKGYSEKSIPIDMSYLAGLARRYDKYLVPWMQSHTYLENRGGLTHPAPEQIGRMIEQHLPFQPDAIMWLGWGKNYTFPEKRADSWEEAGKQHTLFKNRERKVIQPRLAAVRPYTVRALRDVDARTPLDRFFTDTILYDVVINRRWPYDPFEPLRCADLDPAALKEYPFIMAELGSLSKEELQPFVACGKPCILFIEGADRFVIDGEISGIVDYRKSTQKNNYTIETFDHHTFEITAADFYSLDDKAKRLAAAGKESCIWKIGNITFVAVRSRRGDARLPNWIWKSVIDR